jgi:hypothetical protein
MNLRETFTRAFEVADKESGSEGLTKEELLAWLGKKSESGSEKDWEASIYEHVLKYMTQRPRLDDKKLTPNKENTK